MIQIIDNEGKVHNCVEVEKIKEKIEEYENEIEIEKSYLEQELICEEDYEAKVKVFKGYIFMLNKLLEEE